MKYQVKHRHVKPDCPCPHHVGSYNMGYKTTDINYIHAELNRYNLIYGKDGWIFWVEEVE